MKFLIVINVLCVVSVYSAAILPPEIPKCNIGDTTCIGKAFTEVLHNYPKGLPSLSLPPFDPLRVNSLVIDQDSERPLNIKLKFKNMDFFGVSKGAATKLVGFERNPKKSKYELVISVPKLTVISDYEVNGRVLVLPIQGKGKSNFTLENCQIFAKFSPKVTERNGKQYLQIEDKFKLTFETSRLHLKLENLFNGDRALGDNMNLFLNENWRDILDEIRPPFAEAIKQVLKSYINRIFKNLAYEDLWLN